MTRAHQVPRWRRGSLRDLLADASVDETRFRQVLGVLDVEGDLFEHPLDRPVLLNRRGIWKFGFRM